MLAKTKFDPTPEQSSIIERVKHTTDNLLVNAFAGTGKTTTLEMTVDATPQQPVLCLAFNKSIATEMLKRFPNMIEIREIRQYPETSAVGTFNGLGHFMCQNAFGKVTVDTKKTYNAFKEAKSL